MERYQSLYEKSSITTTLEFFLDGGKVIVIYNNIKMPFLQFLDKKKYPESRVIINYMYQKIMNDFYNLPVVKYALANKEPKENIILNFITEYMSVRKNPLDVIIKNSGQIIFNPEKFPEEKMKRYIPMNEKTPSGKVITEFIFKNGIEYKDEFSSLVVAKTYVLDFVKRYINSEEHEKENNPLIAAHCYQPNIEKGYLVYANDAFKLVPKIIRKSKIGVSFGVLNRSFKDKLKYGRIILYKNYKEEE